ncbi:MAG: 50S ribosomal protein L22 [Chloroflexota bacterium]
MEVRAISKNIGISDRKMRAVVDLVRGKRVEEALNLLRFTPTPIARVVAKTVKSAAANAENNYHLSPAELRIIHITASKAPTLKRFRARARGRANRILKRSSHLTVVVSEGG